MSDLLEAENEEQALEQLHELGCTDGLPVVIPTPERVNQCVLASGMDGDMLLGELGPAMGNATVEKVATAAVMAGCKPDYMPLVVAAALSLKVDCTHTLEKDLQATGEFTSASITHGDLAIHGKLIRMHYDSSLAMMAQTAPFAVSKCVL